MIIFRYFAKEIFHVFLMISGILLLLCLSHQVAHYLQLTATGKLLNWQLLQLILLEIPQLFSLIFPLGLYLSILLVYSRLAADSEMTVLKSCGLSEAKLLKMTLCIAMIVAIIIALLTLWVNPWIANSRNQLLSQIGSNTALQALAPGYFQQVNNGNQIFYIEKASQNRQVLQNIFLAERAKTGAWTVMSAQKGTHWIESKTQDHFIVAQHGCRYNGLPGNKDFTVYDFEQYGLRLNAPISYLQQPDIDGITTKQLWRNKHKSLEYLAELQWRLSLPIAVLVLAVFAFILSHLKLGQNRYSRFFPAVLIYIIYANFMLISQDWMNQGYLSPYLGLWLLPSIMLSIGSVLYAGQQHVFKRLFHQ